MVFKLDLTAVKRKRSVTQHSHTSTVEAVTAIRHTQVHHHHVLRHGNSATLCIFGYEIYIRKSRERFLPGEISLAAPIRGTGVPLIICSTIPVQISAVVLFNGHHTGYRGNQRLLVHLDTTINKVHRIPTLQGTGQSTHVIGQSKCNSGIIQCTIHNEHLQTGSHTAQVKSCLIDGQYTTSCHANFALCLRLLNGDVTRKCTFPGKNNIVQRGIFGCRTSIELHARQHSSIDLICRGNEVVHRYCILRHRTPDITGKLQLHILQSTTGYAVGTHVQRYTTSELEHTTLHLDIRNAPLHRIRDEQRAFAGFGQRTRLEYRITVSLRRMRREICQRQRAGIGNVDIQRSRGTANDQGAGKAGICRRIQPLCHHHIATAELVTSAGNGHRASLHTASSNLYRLAHPRKIAKLHLGAGCIRQRRAIFIKPGGSLLRVPYPGGRIPAQNASCSHRSRDIGLPTTFVQRRHQRRRRCRTHHRGCGKHRHRSSILRSGCPLCVIVPLFGIFLLSRRCRRGCQKPILRIVFAIRFHGLRFVLGRERRRRIGRRRGFCLRRSRRFDQRLGIAASGCYDNAFR